MESSTQVSRPVCYWPQNSFPQGCSMRWVLRVVKLGAEKGEEELGRRCSGATSHKGVCCHIGPKKWPQSEGCFSAAGHRLEPSLSWCSHGEKVPGLQGEPAAEFMRNGLHFGAWPANP